MHLRERNFFTIEEHEYLRANCFEEEGMIAYPLAMAKHIQEGLKLSLEGGHKLFLLGHHEASLAV